MKKALLLLLASASPLFADVAFDSIFGHNMVLQQGAPITVSGTCKGSGPVSVTFGDQKVQAEVKGGKWKAELAPLDVNAQGQTLSVTQGSDTATCDNVLVGEVWLASGQSNMLWRLNQTGDGASINAAANDRLRLCHHQPQVHTDPKAYTADIFKTLEDGGMYESGWEVASPQSVAPMSAVAFYFAREIQNRLKCPVGIVDVALGGSEMLAWMPEKALKKKFSEFSGDKWLKNKDLNKQWLMGRVRQNLGAGGKTLHPYKPSYLFENGVARWTALPFAGVIWYQGESDAELLDNKFYSRLMRSLISSWRAEFKKADLPFLMVQLPRINSSEPLRRYWPEFRWIQSKVAADTRGVECVCTIDLGSTDSNVHPKRKLEVGQRLAYTALNKVYGKSDIACKGPNVRKVTFQGNKAILEMNDAEGLKTKDGAAPACFELSADGKKFEPAEATIVGTNIQLTSEAVRTPKHVRYAWATYVEPNLVNASGLPCEPYTSQAEGKGKRRRK